MRNDVITGVSRFNRFQQSVLLVYMILILVMFFSAGNIVIGRGIHTDVPPVGLSFWRWFVGGLLLLPFVWRGLFTSATIIRSHMPALSLLGCLIVGSSTLILIALNFTTAINVSLVVALQSIITVLFAWVFLKEKLIWTQLLGVIAGLVGVVVLLSKADWRMIIELQINIGDIIALLGILGFATYAININKIPKELRATESLFIIIMLGSLALTPFYLLETILYREVPVNTTAITAILIIALTASLFVTLMWNIGNQILGPSRAGMFINLIPVFTAILAIAFLGEHLYFYHIAGTVLISCGIYLVLRRSTGSTNRPL